MADDMFEKLGYRKEQRGPFISYISSNGYDDKCVIAFNNEDRTVGSWFQGRTLSDASTPRVFNQDELKAVYEKARELGWL